MDSRTRKQRHDRSCDHAFGHDRACDCIECQIAADTALALQLRGVCPYHDYAQEAEERPIYRDGLCWSCWSFATGLDA